MSMVTTSARRGPQPNKIPSSAASRSLRRLIMQTVVNQARNLIYVQLG